MKPLQITNLIWLTFRKKQSAHRQLICLCERENTSHGLPATWGEWSPVWDAHESAHHRLEYLQTVYPTFRFTWSFINRLNQ